MGAAWTGERGRISAAMLERAVPRSPRRRVHICGPTEMTEPIRQMLHDLGVPDESIATGIVHITQSSSLGRSRGVRPVATRSRTATDAYEEREASHHVRPLETSRRQLPRIRRCSKPRRRSGVAINYDCRAGICGQCKIKRLAGRVVMEAEDALTAADRANDMILSCQARCIDQVVVEA